VAAHLALDSARHLPASGTRHTLLQDLVESMQSRGGSPLFGAITEPPLDRINRVDYRAHACRLPSGTVLAVITERKILGKAALLA